MSDSINTINVGGVDKLLEDTVGRNEMVSEITRLDTKIDNIITPGGAPSEAEIIDARIGVDGTIYSNLGNAIRNQCDNLKSEIENDYDSLTKVINLIDETKLIDNKFYDPSTGDFLDGNHTTKALPLIPVSAGDYYFYTDFEGQQVMSFVIFNSDKSYSRKLIPYELRYGSPKFSITGIEAYIGISLYNEQVGGHTAIVPSIYKGYFKGLQSSLNVIPPHYSIDLHNFNNIITVDKKGNGDYTTISDAVASITDDSVDRPYTIIIYPGVYKETVVIRGGRHISLIGINMKDCVIRDDTGLYENSPLQIQGDCLIENLTIIATHDESPSLSPTGNKAYAIHMDYDGAGISTVRNCRLISYQSSAIGAGLHQNQTLFIDNCELESHTPNDLVTTAPYGALFVHADTGSNVTNQRLIVKNCMLTSEYKNVCAFSNSPDGTSNMDIDLINNNFWCADGNDDITVKEWYNPVYSGRCFGNNIAKLNGN